MSTTAKTSAIVPMIESVEGMQREFGYDPARADVFRLVARTWAGQVLEATGERISYGRGVEDADEARTIGWALYRAFGIGNTELMAALMRGYLEAAEWQRRGTVPPDIKAQLDA